MRPAALLLAALLAACVSTLATVPCRTDTWHCTWPMGRCCDGLNGSCCEVP